MANLVNLFGIIIPGVCILACCLMIVVDVETSGLDPQKHPIVSLSALDFSHSENKFYEECRIFKGAEIAQEALLINGFSEEELRSPSRSENGSRGLFKTNLWLSSSGRV